MKYKVKSDVFESKQCTFDGQRAVSYGWYTFARRMPDNTWLFTSERYSMQTGRHIREVENLLRGETINYVYAPRGLSNARDVRRYIGSAIRDMHEQINNTRNRNFEWRRSRLWSLYEQLELVRNVWNDGSDSEVQDV